MQFMRFLGMDSSKLQPWREHCRRVTGHSVALAPTSLSGRDIDRSVVVWNLVSGNNRVLARSATIFPHADEANSAAESVTGNGGTLKIRMTTDEIRGVYGWFGTIDGAAVITCARWYSTERDRRQSIELAVISLPVALIQPGARLVHPELVGGTR